MSIRIIKTEKQNEHNLIARSITKNPSSISIADNNNFVNVTDFVNNLFKFDKWQSHEVFRTGTYKLLGWEYDFRPWLNLYWYETHYGDLRRCYCINKKMVRKFAGCRVNRIIQIKD